VELAEKPCLNFVSQAAGHLSTTAKRLVRDFEQA